MRENGGEDVDLESGTPARRARPNPLATLVQGHASPSKVARATRRLASTTVKTTAGALNKGVDLVGDAVVEGAVGATATLGGKELIWKYLDLIFEDLDKKTVSVSDAGVTIAGPSRVKQRTLCALLGGSSPLRRVELGPLEVSVPLDEIATGKGDTPARLALTTASCEWLPFPDLLPYDEVYEVLSALMDPHAAELNLVDEADASRGARRRFDRDRRDRRDVVVEAELRAARPRSASVLDRLEGRAFVFLLMGFIVVSLTSALIWRRAHVVELARLTISAFFVGDIAARLALYGALKPRGARQFFEGWLNRIDFAATVLDVVIWSINFEERATGASQSARGARLVRFLRVSRAITRVGRAAAASARVAKNVLLKKSEDELRRLDGVLLTADEVTITAPAPSEALVADWFRSLKRNLDGGARTTAAAAAGDAAVYVIRDLRLANARADGEPARDLADCGAVVDRDDVGGAVATCLVTRKTLTAGAVALRETRPPFAALGDAAMAFPVDVDVVLHRRTVDGVLARVELDLRATRAFVKTLGNGAALRVAVHGPENLERETFAASWLARSLGEKSPPAGETADAWLRRARSRSSAALLWAVLGDWLRTEAAVRFFAERDDRRAEQPLREDDFLKATSDAGLVLDASEYEALREFAFDGGRPSAARFAAVCARGDAWVPAAAATPAPPRRSAFLSTFLAGKLRATIAPTVDGALRCLAKNWEPGLWAFRGADGLVIEPLELDDDVVCALMGGMSCIRNARVGEIRVVLPSLRGLIAADAPVVVEVASLAYDLEPFPNFLSEADAEKLLAPLFGGGGGGRAPYGSTDRLIDGLEVHVERFSLRQLNPTEELLRAKLDRPDFVGDGAPAKPKHFLAAVFEPLAKLLKRAPADEGPRRPALGVSLSEVSNRQLSDVGAGGWRSLSAQRVSATNAARDFSRPARSLRESIDHGGDAVRVHKRVSIAGLAVVDVDAADNAVPVLRSADLELRLVLGRGAGDGALRAVDVDVFAPPLHALSAALPVSLSLAARVAVGGGAPADEAAWRERDAADRAVVAAARERFAACGADAGAWAALLADAKAGRGDVSAEDAARFEGLGLL